MDATDCGRWVHFKLHHAAALPEQMVMIFETSSLAVVGGHLIYLVATKLLAQILDHMRLNHRAAVRRVQY